MSARRPLPEALRRLLAVIGVLVLALGMVTTTGPLAHAEGKDDKIKRKAEIDRQIDELRGQLLDVDQQLTDTYLALARTELEIPQAQKDLDDAQIALAEARTVDQQAGDRLRAAEDEETRLTGEAQAGQDEVDRSDEEIKRLSIDAYKGGGDPDPAQVFLGGGSPQGTVDRSMNYRITLEARGTRLGTLQTDQAITLNTTDRLTAVRAEVADLKTQAAAAVETRVQAEQDAQTAKDDLDALYEQQTQQKADLEAKKIQFQDSQGDLQDQSSGLDQEITQLTEQERAAAQRGAPVRTVPDNAGTGGDGVDPRTGFMRPVPGVMNSTFGWRMHPIFHYRKLHAGDDFPVACGVPVRATQDGTVLDLTTGTGAGNKVILSHGVRNGKVVTSSYHHLQRFAVSKGQTVSRGDVVGYVGTTGSSTGCHLHFEIHEDGTPVDPAGYV
ncbi:murein hydrolase activator EnvC family protein [Brachybacterium huguangmaarense]